MKLDEIATKADVQNLASLILTVKDMVEKMREGFGPDYMSAKQVKEVYGIGYTPLNEIVARARVKGIIIKAGKGNIVKYSRTALEKYWREYPDD